MKENNKPFIDQVAEFYYSTVDEAHPQGNMSAVADQFGITRAKVNKILITAGVIDSPLHKDIMELKAQGYETDDIAAALGVSAATVRINIPYEKVIYNGEEKSAGAVYVEEYRKREQIFLNSVVRKKTDREIEREIYLIFSTQNKDYQYEDYKVIKEQFELDNNSNYKARIKALHEYTMNRNSIPGFYFFLAVMYDIIPVKYMGKTTVSTNMEFEYDNIFFREPEEKR